MISPSDWQEARRLFHRAFRSSFHFAVASVRPDGAPHVTPIGSLILSPEVGHAFYFERYTRALPAHAARDGRVCVLAVNTSALFWLGSLRRGLFATPPAVRLAGRLAPQSRLATEAEHRAWARRTRATRWLRGHHLLWGDLDRVRDLALEAIEPVLLGEMTRGLTLGRRATDVAPSRANA